MSLEQTLAWADRFPMDQCPDDYSTPEPVGEPNWRWVDLWVQENPNPGRGGFDDWYAERSKMDDRVWVAWCLPQFRVFDWSDGDVAHARETVSRHVCGVCGRSDDPGCWAGC